MVAPVSRRPRARAEVWQYVHPGHRDHGTWAFQVIERPWDEPMPDPSVSRILAVPGDCTAWPTWRTAFDAALAAVRAVRTGDTPRDA